ncbi:MAG: hypothetical protein ACRBF0_13920 [Calditrichia bacterium]
MELRWKKLLPGLIERHRVIDLRNFPWFRVPAIVRIAIYAEGSIRFNGGSFDGLQRVIAALQSDPWPWVKFKVTLIHRNSDPSADMDNKTLDEIDLEKFDELWLFGISSRDLLSADELNVVHDFMDNGGGVLHTGDHASLGKGIAGSIKRAGTMRMYPAPAARTGEWNNTLRSGTDSNYNFTDQSDDEPQRVRLKYYPTWRWSPTLCTRKYPHPILCGKNGPIRVFPDHQHEGEAIAPTTYPNSEWPTKSGYQPKVEVVAWGRIEAPDADVGREVGLVSVYNGHSADVGRIVADSTWHHWFDINLDGFAATPVGMTHLSTIEQYFMNVAAWLAPKSKQSSMRNGIVVFASWRDPLVMLDPKILTPWFFGGLAKDAIGQFAPQCLIRQWILDILPPKMFADFKLIHPDPGPKQELRIPLPLEDLVLASAIKPVLERNLKASCPEDVVDLDFVDECFSKAVPEALEVISKQADLCRQLKKVADSYLKK